MAVCGREPRGHRIQAVGVARTQHQLGPALRKQQRSCLANPTAGTGYRDYLAINRHGPEATRSVPDVLGKTLTSVPRSGSLLAGPEDASARRAGVQCELRS